MKKNIRVFGEVDDTWYGNYVTLTDEPAIKQDELLKEGYIYILGDYNHQLRMLKIKGLVPVGMPKFFDGKGEVPNTTVVGWKQQFEYKSEFAIWLEDFQRNTIGGIQLRQESLKS